MTDQAMSPLRRRMIEDMTVRKFAPKTQHDYLQRVKNFAAYLGSSPDTATSEDVRHRVAMPTATVISAQTSLAVFFSISICDVLKRSGRLNTDHFCAHDARREQPAEHSAGLETRQPRAVTRKGQL